MIAGRRRVVPRLQRAAWLAVAAGLAGCIFHDAPPTRYYAPPSAYARGDDAPGDPAPAARPVRLSRVRAVGYLSEQIVWRSSDVERGLYEQRRWTEYPSRYLDRALTSALDRTPSVRRVDRGHVPTLDVELVAFDEVLAPTHEADVQVAAVLRGAEHQIIFDRIFSAQRSIADPTGAGAARAIGAALDDVVEQIASQVAAELPTPGPTPRSRG